MSRVVREDFYIFPRLYHPVAMAVSDVVRRSQVLVQVHVAIATVRDAVRASVLVVELAVGTDIVTESVCI